MRQRPSWLCAMPFLDSTEIGGRFAGFAQQSQAKRHSAEICGFLAALPLCRSLNRSKAYKMGFAALPPYGVKPLRKATAHNRRGSGAHV